MSLVSQRYRYGVLDADNPFAHFALGIVTGMAAGFFEEIGWTGFLVPRLRARKSLLRTGIVVGLLWGAWHLLVIWWGSTNSIGNVPTVIYLPAMTLTFLIPFRVLMVWVHDRTQSLLLAMIMHASLTASVRIFDPLVIAGWPIVIYNVVLGAAFWLAALAVVKVRPQERRIFQNSPTIGSEIAT
jgi:membrane protease YdiL (CAAX protease family)